MSMRKTPEAVWTTLGAPVYPRAIKELVWALTAKSEYGMLGDRLRRAMGNCPGHRSNWSGGLTDDGYAWPWMAQFNLPGESGGVVVVAIPDMNDAARTDGVRCDRSPAVYIGPGVTVRQAGHVVKRLAEAIRQLPPS